MVPVKSFMVPAEKFVKVDRDTDVRKAAEIIRDREIGSLFVTSGDTVIGLLTDTDLVRRPGRPWGATHHKRRLRR